MKKDERTETRATNGWTECSQDELTVRICRAQDGKLVVEIEGPGDDDCIGYGVPDIRIWLNEALIYRHGETGDDLS